MRERDGLEGKSVAYHLNMLAFALKEFVLDDDKEKRIHGVRAAMVSVCVIAMMLGVKLEQSE